MIPAVRLTKIKRPGGTLWFDLRQIHADEHGTWLYGAVGAPWSWTPTGGEPETGGLDHAAVMLLAEGRPWVGWWLNLADGRQLSIDVCLPTERTPHGWTFVDLELDPVRHETNGRVEIEDWPEFDQALAQEFMSSSEGDLARRTAEQTAEMLRRGEAPWLRQGWDLLDAEL
ncbi:DUF402 domain-containing protein [Kineosporia babensis]|uniref:DUF402 domain-containing protein n=1 Tax=Kineosporia babensis TaxID=499548 RepID=A0A9X1NA82_9ACTN|nr:DUF402 domain-containing protein [Kineosporia babensis]MCD5310169.1 DUF402 domain-containing protein [Kineosporia babensis]